MNLYASALHRFLDTLRGCRVAEWSSTENKKVLPSKVHNTTFVPSLINCNHSRHAVIGTEVQENTWARLREFKSMHQGISVFLKEAQVPDFDSWQLNVAAPLLRRRGPRGLGPLRLQRIQGPRPRA